MREYGRAPRRRKPRCSTPQREQRSDASATTTRICDAGTARRRRVESCKRALAEGRGPLVNWKLSFPRIGWLARILAAIALGYAVAFPAFAQDEGEVVIAMERDLALTLKRDGFDSFASRFHKDFTLWIDGRKNARAEYLAGVAAWRADGNWATSTQMRPVSIDVFGDLALSRYVLREDFVDGTSFVGRFVSLARRGGRAWQVYRSSVFTIYRGPTPGAPKVEEADRTDGYAGAAQAATEIATPAPDGLRSGVDRLSFLRGEWIAALLAPTAEGGWNASGDKRIEIVSDMNDLYLETQIQSGSHLYELVFSYDVAQDRYRITSRDDQSGLIDVYEGKFDASGALVVTNLDSGTHYLFGGERYHNRMTFTPMSDGGWSWLVEATSDTGASWRPQIKTVTKRTR